MSNTIITERGKVLWVQCVASKSGKEPHMVRCFEGGVITCDCPGFMWGGKCSHIDTGKAQEARETQVEAELKADKLIAQARELKADYRAANAEIAARASTAHMDLFGAEWAVR